MKRDYALFVVPSLAVVLLDQISKWLVITHLGAHRIVFVIPGFFNLVMVKNKGMAFGIFNQTRSGLPYYFLIATTILAIVVIFYFFYWSARNQRWLTAGLSLILGGAVGNLVDRIRWGYVIDFLDFFFKGYHWPAFNVADAAVTGGTLWLFLNIIMGKSFGKGQP